MPNLLKNLEVTRVSLVNRAAVRDPSNPTQPQRLLLWKRDDSTPGGTMPTTAEELTAALEKADLPDSVKQAIEKAQEREDALAKATEELTKATESVTELTAKVEKLEKAASSAGADDDDEDDLQKALAKADPALRDALLKADAERKTLEKAANERIEKAEKAAEEAQNLAKAERETRLSAEFITKAEGFKALPIEAAKFGPVLKSAAEKLSKEESEELDRVLKAADAQINAGELFKQQGRDGVPPAADSAIAEVQRKAEELKKADPKLSDSHALDKAMTSDRALQERYLAEQHGA